MTKSVKQLNEKEAGFVSIVVTMIVLIVLTILAIGYAQISRREQSNSLDRQLSTQAFYAAESGVNDLKQALIKSINNGGSLSQRTNCSAGYPIVAPGFGAYMPSTSLNYEIDSANHVKYTCLLYDSTLDSLNYTVSTDKPVVIPIEGPAGGVNFNRLSINWKGDTSGYRAGAIGAFTNSSTSSWNSGTGVLRVMLINRDFFSRGNYLNQTYNGFFYPNEDTSGASSTSVGSTSFAAASGVATAAAIVGGYCNDTKSAPLVSGCNVDLTIPSGSKYYLVLRSIYSTSNVQIRGFNNLALQSIRGAQVMIDATGQSGDVLRRIQTRVPLKQSTDLPFAFQSVYPICKQIKVAPPATLLDETNNNTGNGCSF